MTPALEPLRRIAAYAVCMDSASRVLLVRASPRSGTPGVWSLPGGAVDHGEDPNDTVVRETAAETGLSVAVSRLHDVLADMRALPHRGITIHTDRLIYHVRVRGGTLCDRVDQPTDLARWHTLDEAARLPLRPFTATALGLPAAAVDLRPDEPPEYPSFHAVPGPDGLHRAQRFAAYAVATDPHEPGAAHPHRRRLPRRRPVAPARRRHRLRRAAGRGADPRAGRGDRPARALVELLGVASHRDAASLGPEGYPIDWHGVRAFYRVAVDGRPRPRSLTSAGPPQRPAGSLRRSWPRSPPTSSPRSTTAALRASPLPGDLVPSPGDPPRLARSR